MRASLLLPAMMFAALSACATSPGDTLLSRGQYESAAAAFEADLKVRPGDPSLLRKRDQSRHFALLELAKIAKEAFARGEVEIAHERTIELLQLSRAWGGPASAEPLLTERRAWLREQMVQGIEAHLAAGAPLRAQALLRRSGPVVEAFWSPAEASAASTRIRALGGERCQRARRVAADAGPFSQRVVERYCGYFGMSQQARVSLPGLYGRLEIDAKLPGVEDGDLEPLRKEVQRAFELSPWHEPTSEQTLRIVTGGEVQEIWVTVTTTHRLDAQGRPHTQTHRSLSSHRMPVYGGVGGNSFLLGYSARLFAEVREPLERAAKVEPLQWVNESDLHGRRSLSTALGADARRLGQRLETTLVRMWGELFCQPTEADVEKAARCVYGQPDARGQRGVALLFGDVTPEAADAVAADAVATE